MSSFKFSIGKVELKQSGVTIKTIEPTQSIDIDHSISTSREVNPDGEVTDEYKEEEVTTISITFAEDNFDTSLAVDDEYDLVFTTVNNYGLSVTLANCKITGYRVNSSQGQFITATITFSKRGAIDDSPGDTPTKQTVTFSKTGGGTVSIGDSAYVNVSYQGNVQPFIIPTALGVLVQSTNELGGGQLSINVDAHVNKSTRLELEQYLINLYSQLSTETGTLTVTYGGSSYTIANCSWVNGSPANSNKVHSRFSLAFIKSGY